MYSVFESDTHFGLQPATLGYTALPPTCIGPGMSSRSLEINVSKISGAAEQFVSDRVAIEEPLEIRLGYSTSDGRTTTSISITMRTKITERVKQGVVYTAFHNPKTGANLVTTEYSDWATNCPEYKVTAVQVTPATHRSNWQDGFAKRAEQQGKIAEPL